MAVILSAENIPDDIWIEINKQARKEFNSEFEYLYNWFEKHYSANRILGEP